MGTALMVMLLAAGPSLTVVARGAPVDTLLPARTDVELRLTELPNAPSTTAPHALSEERIALARKAYVDADFAKCAAQVNDDATLLETLAQGDRAGAARLLLWRIACGVGAGRKPAAALDAHTLAALRLEIPGEAGQVSPEVEAVIGAALKQAATEAPVHVEVVSNGEAAIALDGRPAGCSTPCTLDVLQGTHVLRLTEDGFEPAVRQVPVGATKVVVELKPAAPELASAQWTARYAQAPDFDGARSAQLLSTALRASRLVMLTVEPNGRQQALLAVDGNVTARAERLGELSAELPGLLDDLLVRGRVVEQSTPLYKRPLFWIALVAGVAVVAVTATAIVVTARRQAEVHF